MKRTIPIFAMLFLFIVPAKLLAQKEASSLSGIIIGKYANVRNLPTVVNTRIITRAYKGTAITILDRSKEQTKVGELQGYWLKIDLLEKGIQGWVFDKYIALEGDSRIDDYIRTVVKSLYYYRPEIDLQLAKIKKSVSKPNALVQLKKSNTRFLNYIGYRLLAERNTLAFPALIAFMNPEFEKTNSKDANYLFTWELLEKITPYVFITNTYKSFRYWWQRGWGRIKITIPSYEMAAIFKKIQENENKVYRKVLGKQIKKPVTPKPAQASSNRQSLLSVRK